MLLSLNTVVYCDNSSPSNQECLEKQSATRTQDATTLTLSCYANNLKKLDARDPNSVRAAINEYDRLFDKRGALSDKGYISFENYFYEVIESQNKRLNEETSNSLNKAIKSLDPSQYEMPAGYLSRNQKTIKNKALDALYENGMDLFISEGDIYIGERPGFLYESFSNKVSPDLSEFLKLRSNELGEGFQDDAHLLISFSKVADRVGRWEQYIMKYPHSIMLDEAKHYYNMYLGTLLFGLDGSRVFEDKNTIRRQNIHIYKNYIASHQGAKSSFLINEYIMVLGKDNFKWGDNVNLFIKKHNIEVLIGVQPPTR